MNLEKFSEEEHRKAWYKHSTTVDRADDLSNEIFQQMRGLELNSFIANNADYRTWRNSTGSCMLILSGRNNISVEDYQCWLSPIATATMRDVEQQRVHPLYAYYALPQFLQSATILYDVVSVVLLQLLRRKSHALRDEQRYAELRTALGKFHQTVIDERKKVTAMENVALRALDFFDEAEIAYIVVDRADWCREKTVDHRKNLLKVLVKMVEAARCKLKILTVVDGYSWPVKDYHDELGAKMSEKLIVYRAEQGTKD